MTDTFRALCAELAQQLDDALDFTVSSETRRHMKSLVARARAALAQPEADASQISDGYHTFAELYEHRHALCLALMRAMPQQWWFSRRHADGETCFGGNDWFIVGAELPGLDDPSVTYHLPMRLWDVAQATGAQELPKGRPWDGHTAQDVVDRFMLWAALAQPEPVGPTDEEAQELFNAIRVEIHGTYFDKDVVLGHESVRPGVFARAILARWGSHTAQPVPADLTDEALMAAAKAAVDTYPRVSELPYFMDPDATEYEPMLLALRAAAAMGRSASAPPSRSDHL